MHVHIFAYTCTAYTCICMYMYMHVYMLGQQGLSRNFEPLGFGARSWSFFSLVHCFFTHVALYLHSRCFFTHAVSSLTFTHVALQVHSILCRCCSHQPCFVQSCAAVALHSILWRCCTHQPCAAAAAPFNLVQPLHCSIQPLAALLYSTSALLHSTSAAPFNLVQPLHSHQPLIRCASLFQRRFILGFRTCISSVILLYLHNSDVCTIQMFAQSRN